MKKQPAPTMKDVAKEAGVALGTVSKVINGIPVGDEYRIRVENAIQKLHYEVNTYARGLKVQKSRIVSLIIPDAISPFYATFAHYIESALYARNHHMILCCSNGIPEKEVHYLTMASQNQFDGVIALTYSDIGKYVAPHLPLVSFDRLFDNTFTPRVASDNLAGGIMATEKLLELGCKHPAFIRFSSKFPGEADKRLDGYLKTCHTHHIDPILLDRRDNADFKKSLLNFILEQTDKNGALNFDGVFCNTDYHAYHLLHLLSELGYRVPEDIQIIGFDGIRKFGEEHGKLFVSSICQPIPKLAQTCVELVLAEERDILPSLTLLPVHYEAGGTTQEPY